MHQEELTGQQVSDLVTQKIEELRLLQIRNIKINISSCSFTKIELDTLLNHFSDISDRAETATDLLKASGLSGEELEAFSMKLARIGLHR